MCHDDHARQLPDAGVKLDKNAGLEQRSARSRRAGPNHFRIICSNTHSLIRRLPAFMKKEAKLFSLFKILSAIAIFIGCLGLYGVVAFMAESRARKWVSARPSGLPR